MELHAGRSKITPLGDGCGSRISDGDARSDGGNCIAIGNFSYKRVAMERGWRDRGNSKAC